MFLFRVLLIEGVKGVGKALKPEASGDSESGFLLPGVAGARGVDGAGGIEDNPADGSSPFSGLVSVGIVTSAAATGSSGSSVGALGSFLGEIA